MTTQCDDSLDPEQPALIVTYGNTAKKHRALNKPVLVLGRARGCDIGLVAPDVSSVHCLIIRKPDGFYLRDCSSRSGTRLNGETIAEALLRDEDILQIGPFSFQAYIPALTPEAVPGPDSSAKIRHLERSRQNFARLALGLRRERRERARTEEELAGLQCEVDRRVDVLREQVRDVEQRAHRLQQAERDLTSDRETLDRELAALQSRIQQSERALVQRQSETEESIRARTSQLEQQLQEFEAHRSQAKTETARIPDPEAARVLAIRHQELAAFAQHLVRKSRRLAEQEQRIRQVLGERAKTEVPTSRRDTIHDEMLGRELEAARKTIADLGRALAEKEQAIERLKRRQQPSAAPPDATGELDRYEAELNHFRRQLESERHELENEAQQLQSRSSELDEVTRTMEVELSRERAELARERMRLEQLRMEACMDLDKARHDADIRGRLEPVQKLREHLQERRRTGEPNGCGTH